MVIERTTVRTGSARLRTIRPRTARIKTIVLSALALLALLGAVASAGASVRFVEAVIGTGVSGNGPSEFNTPRGVAGSERSTPRPISERQRVTVVAASGSFTLTLDGEETAAIAYDASAAAVRDALHALPGVEPADLDVSGLDGGPWTVDFAGTVDASELTADAAGLGGGTAAVETVADGADAAGWFYVVAQSNNRVQAFDADGDFRFMIGRNVNATAAGEGVAQRLRNVCPRPGRPGDACQNGSTGSLGGEFDVAQGVAVDPATGHFFVRERNNNRRVQEFTPDGRFVRAWGQDVVAGNPSTAFETCFASDQCKGAGPAGAGDGQFGSSTTNSTGIAVGPGGDLYVADPGNRRIQRFEVPENPADAVAFVQGIGTSAQFGSNQPIHVAVGADGTIYASNSADSNAVVRYRAGSFLEPIPVSALSGTNSSATSGLAVDPGTGNLMVGRLNTSIGVLELAEPGGAAPTVEDRHLTNEKLGFGSNVALAGVGADSERLLVSAADHRVYVLDEDGPAPVVVDVLPATSVEATTASLHALIDANGPTGSPVSYHFEVSKDGIEWRGVTDPALVPPDGDGPDPEHVTAQATGLEPNTLYLFRVVTSRPNWGGTAISSEMILRTDPAAPVVTTAPAEQVSETSARIVGRVNPGGLETTYWFEWGDTALQNTVPVPAASAGSGGIERAVAESLSDLEPEAVYHYRLCARNTLAVSPVCGSVRSFATRSPEPVPPGRAYEMVTPPDKPLRQGHAGIGGARVFDYARANPAVPATSHGDFRRVRWTLFPGVTDPDAGHGFTWAETREIYTRGSARWQGEAMTRVAPIWGAANAVIDGGYSSSDLRTSAWYTEARLFDNFPEGSSQFIHVAGDDGGPRQAGLYPWLDPAWFEASASLANHWSAYVSEHGDAVVGEASPIQQDGFRSIRPADGGGTATEVGQSAGRALLVASRAAAGESAWRPVDLLNECTGSAEDGDQTLLPTRVGTGDPTDTIGSRPCATGEVTEARGAALAGHRHLDSTLNGTMSVDGKRFFFHSPDPQAADPDAANGPRPDGAGPCHTSTGPATECPPQLFVRQYDGDGNPTVRWISRAEDALFDAPQEIGLYGHGVAFEGASRDGSVVYFRTNAPLTVDDPNGGAQLPGGYTEGQASPDSWDLYRYELGDDLDADPAAGDPADRLTRISGGPDGEADPNVSCETVATSGFQTNHCWGTLESDPPFGVHANISPNGEGGAIRFMSDDGSRVYFITAGGIPGAANEPPTGGATSPTDPGHRVNAQTRNLYLYDASKTGAAAYEFVARIPFSADSTGSGDIDSCASFGPENVGAPIYAAFSNPTRTELALRTAANCVHGTSSGDAIVFLTRGRLTLDDVDSAADIYLYEATTDTLTRISAPPPGASPYVCHRPSETSGVVRARCNADLGVYANKSGNFTERMGFGGFRNWNVAEHPDGTLKAVHFQSRLPLVPEDVNGPGEVSDTGGEGVMDVYEWRNGRLSLLSPGTTQDSAFYSGSSRDGDVVYFWTEQRISAWEIGEADGDLYAAVVGGGLPDPPPPAPLCDVLGGGCHGTGSAPVPVTPTTAAGGGGDAVARPRARLSVARPTAAQRRRAARTGVLTVRVRSSQAGTVRVTARARIGKRRRPVGTAARRLREPGVAAIRLRLNRQARAVLVRRDTLRTVLSVRLSGARAATATVVLRRAGQR